MCVCVVCVLVCALVSVEVVLVNLSVGQSVGRSVEICPIQAMFGELLQQSLARNKAHRDAVSMQPS